MNSKIERLERVQAARARQDWQGALAELEQILRDYNPDANVLSLLALTENDIYQPRNPQTERPGALPSAPGTQPRVRRRVIARPLDCSGAETPL